MKMIGHIRNAMNATSWGWIVALALLTVILPGCVKRTGGDVAGGGFGDDPRVFLDRATGCEYLGGSSGNGITPRLGRDGKQICREAQP